mmetsp:Transcript_115702/g.332345  ORF Transcript_115702/g.332345 Transcript_115702/m.332345 type:complete len:461 (+) Transcript_115702:78-1460(+)
MAKFFAAFALASTANAGITLDVKRLRTECGRKAVDLAIEELHPNDKSDIFTELIFACEGKTDDCRVKHFLDKYEMPESRMTLYEKCLDAFEMGPTQECLDIALLALEDKTDVKAKLEPVELEKHLVEWMVTPGGSDRGASVWSRPHSMPPDTRDVFRTCQQLHGEGASVKMCAGDATTMGAAWAAEMKACKTQKADELSKVTVWTPTGDKCIAGMKLEYRDGQVANFGVPMQAGASKSEVALDEGDFFLAASFTVDTSTKRLCAVAFTSGQSKLNAQDTGCCTPGNSKIVAASSIYGQTIAGFEAGSGNGQPVYPTAFTFKGNLPKALCETRVRSAAFLDMPAHQGSFNVCKSLFPDGVGEGCFALGTGMSTLQVNEVMAKCGEDVPCLSSMALDYAFPRRPKALPSPAAPCRSASRSSRTPAFVWAANWPPPTPSRRTSCRRSIRSAARSPRPRWTRAS